MIKIIEDYNDLLSKKQSKDFIILENLSDFPAKYDSLRKFFLKSDFIEIIVKKSILKNWIIRMVDKYSDQTFDIETIDRMIVLRNEWNIEIPDYVKESDIIECRLNELKLEIKKTDTFEDVILSYFFDPLFINNRFHSDKITDLINAYDKEKWQGNLKCRLISYIFNKQIDQWKSKANDKERRLLELYIENPNKLENTLNIYKILEKYELLANKYLGNDYKLLKSINLNLNNLQIDESKISANIKDSIEIHFKSFKMPNSSDEFNKIILSLSGLLKIEFDYIDKIIKKKPELVTEEIINTIKNVFHKILNRYTKKIVEYKNFIKPAVPEIPDKSWPVEKMLNWVVEKYMPYYSWLLSTKNKESYIYEIGDCFSEWLINNWEDVKNNSKRMLFNLLPNNYKTLNEKDKVVLFIIIDNFNYLYIDILKNIFHNYGYNLIENTPYISMLPTITEISKKIMLSGEPEYKNINQSNYTSIINKGWIPYFEKEEFLYLNDLNKLKDVDLKSKNKIFINFLPIDSVLHLEEKDIGREHLKQIESIVEDMIEKIDIFTQQNNINDSIIINIASDHGSTYIPSSVKNNIDIDFFKSDKFKYVTDRYCIIESSRLKEIPENFNQDIFILDKNQFGNNDYYICARKGNRFVKNKKNNFLHGGILPEEVVVPNFIFSKISEIKNITIYLKNNVFRYRKEIIELEIENPNNIAINDIQIKILNQNIFLSNEENNNIKLDFMNVKDKCLISTEAHFRKSIGDNEIFMNISVFYFIGNKSQQFEIKLPIKMQSMLIKKENTFDF